MNEELENMKEAKLREAEEIKAQERKRAGKGWFAKGYERMCKRASELIPYKLRHEDFFRMMKYGGIEEDYDFWLGKKMVLVLLFGLIGFLIPLTIGYFFSIVDYNTIYLLRLGEITLEIPIIALSIAAGLGFAFASSIAIGAYLHLFYMLENRTSRVEEVLPDFLLLVASGINAGLTPFSAFRSAARKEFEPLTTEVKIATTKSLGTASFQEALKQLSRRIKSRVLDETVSFFSQALRSGGKLSRLLETSANDLRQTQEMKKELRSSTRMYVIFVAFVVIIGTPLLLSISVQFLEMITGIQGDVTYEGSNLGSVGFLSTEINLEPDFMRSVAYVLLTGNALLSSLFIGIISTGNAKLGLRHLPAILIASILAFYAVSAGLSVFFFAG